MDTEKTELTAAEKLASEVGIKCFTDFGHLRYVRESKEDWQPFDRLPTVRALSYCEILAYSYNRERLPLRVWYLLADDNADGLRLVAGPDLHDGLPVVPSTVGSREVSHPYLYCPQTVYDTEILRRASHVSYWNRQRKIDAARALRATKTPRPPRPWYWPF